MNRLRRIWRNFSSRTVLAQWHAQTSDLSQYGGHFLVYDFDATAGCTEMASIEAVQFMMQHCNIDSMHTHVEMRFYRPTFKQRLTL